MSTPNFDHRQLGFPLYAHDEIYSRICPECGAWNDAEEETCYDCGASLDGAEERPDWCAEEDLFEMVNYDLRNINDELDFFTVELKSGYYCGVQFDVNFNDRIGDPEGLDNEDAHYYFDCCRSEMLKRYKRERRKLGKALETLARDHGFDKLVCVGIFSNGEAIYERVPKTVTKYNTRTALKVAACAVPGSVV